MSTYDLIVIGGGPAGYVGAIRGAQLGKKVACVEMERAGGTCLNWGCIPTKALLKNAELYQTLTKKAKEFGLSFENLQYDWSTVIKRSRKVSTRLAGGIEFLFKKNKVDYIRGAGSILGDGKVEVTAADGTKQIIESMDKNGDGKISKDESSDGLKSFFANIGPFFTKISEFDV